MEVLIVLLLLALGLGAYNSVIDRTDAGALIPEEVSREIIQAVPQQSVVMGLARKLPNMPRAQTRMPVLSALVSAYFVNGDTGLKQTTEAAWANVYLNAEEIAAIVPIPEAVLDDADYDIWGEIRPKLVEAFGKVFDAALLFGTNAPASWPNDLLTGAGAAGHTVAVGAIGADLYDDIMAENGVLSLVEADGYLVNGHVAAAAMRARLRGLRDANGLPLFLRSMQDRQHRLQPGAAGHGGAARGDAGGVGAAQPDQPDGDQRRDALPVRGPDAVTVR